MLSWSARHPLGVISHLCVGVVSGRMEEILQKSVNAVEVDISTNYDKLALWIDLKMVICFDIKKYVIMCSKICKCTKN